jgi:hypothetical protein
MVNDIDYGFKLRHESKPRSYLRAACFTGLKQYNQENVEYITYSARPDPCHEPWTDDHLSFWISFCRQVLIDLPFTAEIKEGRVELTMAAPSHSLAHNLLYLTFFRYIDEFAPVVHALYKTWMDNKMQMTTEQLFTAFYEMHVEGPRQIPYGNFYGHGAIHVHVDWICGGSSPVPITLEQFHANLKSDTASKVQLFFAAAEESPKDSS